jgi:hypothetical protein
MRFFLRFLVRTGGSSGEASLQLCHFFAVNPRQGISKEMPPVGDTKGLAAAFRSKEIGTER